MSERPGATVLPRQRAARLSALFDAHADRLYRLARRLVPSTDDAWDLVQDTFLKAARSAESIRQGFTHEEAWLVRVLVNSRRDQWRKEAARRRHARAPDQPGCRPAPPRPSIPWR
jgi:RNA polymerase sigma-70 factor (ECF subfamily)